MSFPSFSSLISTTATHTSARSDRCRCLEMLPMVSQGFLSWIARKQSLLQLLSFFLYLIASEASNYLSDFLFWNRFQTSERFKHYLEKAAQATFTANSVLPHGGIGKVYPTISRYNSK